jgi:hypothetical protein
MHTTGSVARRRSIVGAGLSAAVSAASLLTSLSPASAFTVLPDVDPDGHLSVVGPMISAVGEDRASAEIRMAPLTAYHLEGGDGDQTVAVEYRLQRHVGDDWVTVDYVPGSEALHPDGAVTLPGVSYARPAADSRVEYRVQVRVSWIDDSNQFLLGETTIVPSLWGDAVCQTAASVPCQPTMNGGVSV